MNKKIKTYLLFAAVLGIWGTIAYKIINGIQPDAPVQTIESEVANFTPNLNTQKDTFSIQLSNRDPFLGTLAIKRTASKKAKTNTSNTPINLPAFTYNGLVKNQNASNRVFVISVNQKQYLFKTGQTQDSITLVKGSAKQVALRFKGQLITVKRD